MVLRVDVVAAALEGVYGGLPEHRVVALTPQGRQLDQGVVDELAGEEHLTLLSARFEGFDERILQHLASDALSIGPYVLSGGELPAMVVADAVARRLPGALSEGSGSEESFSAGSRAGSSTRTTRGPRSSGAGRCPTSCSRATTPGSRTGAVSRAAHEPRTEHEKPRRPLTHRLPRPWRVAIDWVVTIVGAVAIVLAIKQWVVNPYRIPSSSMEPTLHCAGSRLHVPLLRPGAREPVHLPLHGS